MAISMDALLKIKADVQGEGAVQSLATKLGAVQGAAAKAQSGFKGLAGAAGGLVGGLQTLVPLATGAGLVAMGKGAIDAADDMNDLSQKTGVSVERLSQLQQAADKSGTSLDAVGGAMVKLNRGLAEGADSKAGEALKSLGINANDATGKLKSTDQIMLEVADKFAKMPDSAQKSALAMQLFGKSGADLIPLLNGGRDSIESLSVTMTGKFAKGADEFNDKMVDLQTGMTRLGVSIGTALLPFIGKLTDALVVLVNGFNTLPGPLQTLISGAALLVIAWGPVSGVLTTVATIAAALGPALAAVGPIIAGWAGAVAPAISAITAALGGLLAWVTGSFLPGLVAVFAAISPVGWVAIAIAGVVLLVIAFRKQLGEFATWLMQWAVPIRKFWSDLWNGLKQLAYNLYIKPLQDMWNGLTSFLPKALQKVAESVRTLFSGMANAIKAPFRVVLQWIANQINVVGGLVNRLIGAFNRLPGPDIPFVPTLSVPAFATGGVVNKPTLAMVGEAGQEYIIPESKMAAASARYLAGARGAAVLGSQGGINIGSPQINVTTGPVLQQDGQQYVTVADLERAMRQTAEGVIGRLRTPSARIALGI